MARKGSLRRKLRSLEDRLRDQRRDLGVAVLEMHRAGEIDERAVSEAAAAAAGTADEAAEIRAALGLSADEPELPEPEPPTPGERLEEEQAGATTLAPAAPAAIPGAKESDD